MATILVVDDLATNRAFLTTLLGYQGHRLLEASDGEKGLAIAQSQHPDLVITDVLMPVVDGYELVRRLRLDPASAHVPVIFYTAHYGEREARTLALASGVSYVLTKPVEPEEVLRVVGQALAGRSETGTARVTSLPSEFADEHLRLLTDKLSSNVGDLRAANARLRALVNIGLELASERDSDRLLQKVCATSRDLLGASHITLGILDHQQNVVERVLACGTPASNVTAAGVPLSGAILQVVTDRRTMRGQHPDPIMAELPRLQPCAQAFLLAPIVSPTLVYGWICLLANEGRVFGDDDEQLLMALCGQVGRIYENGHYYRIARRRTEQLEQEILERQEAESALRESEAFARSVLNSLADNIAVLDDQGFIVATNEAWQRFAEDNHASPETVYAAGTNYLSVVEHAAGQGDATATRALQGLRAVLAGERDSFSLEYPCHSPTAQRWCTVNVHPRKGGKRGAVVVHQDITARTQLELELRQAQKLESVGRLAAGVAHEINTPIQFVNDSMHFIQDAVGDLTSLIAKYRDFRESVAIAAPATSAAVHDMKEAEVAADVDYLLERVPKALSRSLEGLDRVAVIVRSMKEFAHPDQTHMAPLDLNRAVESTLIMARNEYKFVADVVTDFADLPLVNCHGGDVNQVFLNIVVNAAHAVADAVKGTDARGTITVETRRDGDSVIVRIGDTGNGIAEAARARIFDPFFTTKEVGKGTGQGLSIARSVIVDKHGGALTFDTRPGLGTTFMIRLPIAGKNHGVSNGNGR